MKRKTLVLDTSVFVNPDSARAFGTSPTSAVRQFLKMARAVDGVDFCMPPSIYHELMHFAEESKIPKPELLLIKCKPPKKHDLKIPGLFVYDLVESMRDRVDRGLRLAERHVREALQAPPPPKTHSKSHAVRPDAEMIGRLRESYRRIMREGMLDSKADADLLLLAYEISGILVSADQGVLDWAEKFGIETLSHTLLPAFLTEKVHS